MEVAGPRLHGDPDSQVLADLLPFHRAKPGHGARAIREQNGLTAATIHW